jgi:hypothetical protein
VVNGLTPEQHEALANAIREDFEIEPLGETSKLEPGADGTVKIGYLDAHFKQPFMLTLKNPRIADAALPGHSSPYRRLDTAVLEALILKGALGMNAAEAVALVERADYDAAFFMAPTPIEQVRAVAAAGETMPPKSTYFFPKVPTGLVFNALTD